MSDALVRDNGKPIALWPPASQELREMAEQLGYFGYRSQFCEATEDLAAIEPAPACLMVDCSAVETMPAASKAALTDLATKIPLACIADTGDITSRLEAVRLGCQAYFTRPLEMTGLLDTLDRLTAPPRAEAGRVLIVDDSPSLTTFYATYLNAAGFVTHVVNNPLLTLVAMEEQMPELILLDINMPHASGEEIAEVIRQQDAYLSIPIVFLSSEGDIGRQHEALSIGGDEFLQKPIQPEHLISAVKSRVIRHRALRGLMMRDSLTGLLNHTSFKERLRAEVARARRQSRPLSVAMIDIDFFKRVNDSYGHPAGDRVIKSLARLLKQRLRSSDVIGRYGGEEFAAVLPDTNGETALAVLDQLRQSFSAIVQHAGESTFQCTLSAGVASLGRGADGEAMLQIADQALYAAKHGGRNQVKAG